MTWAAALFGQVLQSARQIGAEHCAAGALVPQNGADRTHGPGRSAQLVHSGEFRAFVYGAFSGAKGAKPGRDQYFSWRS